MTEFVHLTGAEDVKRAGSQMASAAESFRQSFDHMAMELQRVVRDLDRVLQEDREERRRDFKYKMDRIEKMENDKRRENESA